MFVCSKVREGPLAEEVLRHGLAHPVEGDLVPLVEEEEQDLLRAARREGGDDDLAPSVDGLVHHRRELRSFVILLVSPIAVRGFDEQVVCFIDQRRIGKHRPAEPTEIAAEEESRAAAPNSHVGGSQQMPGIDEVDFDAWSNRQRAFVTDRLQERDSAKRVGLCVQRECRIVFGEPVPVRVHRVLFLNASGVRQHDAAEIERPRGAKDPAAEALSDEPRQVSAMIEVRMRQHDGMDRIGANRQRLPVALTQLFQSLKQPAVNKHASAVGLD